MAEKEKTITMTVEELQKMVADMVAAKMAEAKNPAEDVPEEAKIANEEAMKEVEIELFYDGDKYKDPVFVGLNGKGYLVKRGEPVKVPAAISEIIRNAEQQNRIARGVMREAEKKLEEFNKE